MLSGPLDSARVSQSSELITTAARNKVEILQQFLGD
jgi:hypothetical protein